VYATTYRSFPFLPHAHDTVFLHREYDAHPSFWLVAVLLFVVFAAVPLFLFDSKDQDRDWVRERNQEIVDLLVQELKQRRLMRGSSIIDQSFVENLEVDVISPGMRSSKDASFRSGRMVDTIEEDYMQYKDEDEDEELESSDEENV
jgi:hypothetical protein